MPDNREPVHLGLIGCGWVTETLHLPVLTALPDVEVVAVADTDPVRLNRVADRFQIKHRYTNYSALFDDRVIEAIGVWVPPDCQIEVAQAVLAAGKHLFIDKPLVFDLNAWDQLIEQAAQAGRKVMVVGLPRRWHRLIRRAREVIRQGSLGKLELIRTVLTGVNPERLSLQGRSDQHVVRGILYQFGVHHFDLWHFLLQSEVEEVLATRTPDESTVVVTARLPDDLLVSSTFSEGKCANDEVEIYGQAGRLRVSCYRFDGFEYFPPASHPGDFQTRVRQAVHTLRALPRGLLGMRQGGFMDSYRVGWQHFADSLRQDTRPDCTLEDGRRALQVVLAARESAALGRPVKVTQMSHDRRGY